MARGSDSKPWHTCKTVIFQTCPLPPRKPFGASAYELDRMPELLTIAKKPFIHAVSRAENYAINQRFPVGLRGLMHGFKFGRLQSLDSPNRAESGGARLGESSYEAAGSPC